MDIRCCQVASAANDRVSTRASPNLIELEQHDSFQHIFSLMGPETLEGAKGVLDFAQASKACMRIARGTYLRPINTGSSPVDARCGISAVMGKLSVLREAPLTAERCKVGRANLALQLPTSKTSFKDRNTKFNHFSHRCIVNQSKLETVHVLLTKEANRANQQWVKVRERGVLIFNVNKDAVLGNKDDFINSMQSAVLDELTKLANMSVTSNDGQFEGWRWQGYAQMFEDNARGIKSDQIKIPLIGVEVAPTGLVEHALQKLVIVSLLSENQAEAVAQKIAVVRDDAIPEM